MSDYLAKLNPDQRSVVDVRGNNLAIACPGSGKTSTLASKAATLLEDGDRVVAVTFTKDAALELRERIVKLAGPSHNSRLLVGTFHSICLFMAFPSKSRGVFGRDILSAVRSPFKEEWDLVKTGVQFGYVGRALREAGLKMKVGDALSMIEAAKEAGSFDDLDPDQHDLVTLYTEMMERSGKIDFQDIILKTNKALREGTLTPLPADHLLVDEFQDTDRPQYEWIGHHAKAGVAVTAVGDDDQSIYAFRRAMGYDAMDRFTNDFGAERILLGVNYRCHSEILGAAEQLIANNQLRIDKRLVAHKGPGGIVQFEQLANVATESAAVAEEAALAMQEGAEFAVIARTNRELVDIQRALLERNIPFRKADGSSIFDYLEVQTYQALLRALIKPIPSDIDQVLGWTGMSESDVKGIRNLFGSAIRIGSAKDFAGSVSEEGRKIWQTFAKRYNEWLPLLHGGMYQLLNMGVHEWLLDTIQKPNSEYVLQTAADLFDPKGKTLAKHLSDLRLAEMNARKEQRAAEDSGAELKNVVWLLTAHGSKGLEFDRVWIIGVEHDSFPSENSSLSEERRLMFVAMTRAKSMLWVSATKEKRPSLFVYEAGLLESPIHRS